MNKPLEEVEEVKKALLLVLNKAAVHVQNIKACEKEVRGVRIAKIKSLACPFGVS